MEDSHPASTTIPSHPTTAEPTTEPVSSKADATTAAATTTPKHAVSVHARRSSILRLFSALARSTDHNLLRLSKLLSTPSGIDVLLCTTGYTLTLVHALLSRLLETRLAAVASDIAAKADGILLPGETLIASLPAPASTKLIAHIVGSSKAVADTISDFRIFVRMWGLLGLYTWARATYLEPLPADAGAKEKTLRGLTWTAIASLVVFQVLENGAYLSSKGALTTSSWTGDVGKARENQWWIWSSRFWAVYVGVELARLGVERYCRTPAPTPTVGGDGEKEDKLKRVEAIKAQELENWLWWKDLASNLAYAPMTLHWSVETGFLSEWGVGVCGTVAGGALLVDAWRKTA